MCDDEIKLVLFEKPGLISRCAKPSFWLQHTACEKSPSVVKFIDEPDASVVNHVVERDVKNILLIKPQFRTLHSEVLALLNGVFKLNQVNKQRLVEDDYNTYHSDTFIALLKTVEKQRDSLTSAQLETFRLRAAEWSKEGSLKYMHNPSKAVKEKAVDRYPLAISDIRFQYPAIQEIALFSAFRIMCREENCIAKSNTTIDSVYALFKNPSTEVNQIYKELSELYHNLGNVKKIKHQNEDVQLGCLKLALAKRIDISPVFALFQKPSKTVTEYYTACLEQIERDKRHEMFMRGLGYEVLRY